MNNKMSNKTKTLLGIVVFVIFIAVSAFAYNNLKQKVAPPEVFSAESSATPLEDLSEAERKEVEERALKNAQEEGGQAENTEKMLAPDFTVLDTDGNEVKLSSLFGKPIVMNFWASWCPPCKGEMPDFNKVYEEMGEDITFVMIDAVDGQRETIEKGKKHVEDNAYTFPVYYDSNQEAAYLYSIYALPTTFFIDKDGYIVTGVESAIDEKTLKQGIDLIK